MQLKIIYISTITMLLATVSMPSAFKLSAPFFIPQVLTQTSNTRKAEADRLFNQGREQYNNSQFQAALDSWQQALKIYREIGDRRGEDKSLMNLGVAHRNLGQYQKAIEFYQQSLTIAREIGDRSGEGISLNNLGLVLYKSGNLSEAEKTLFESIKVYESLREFSGNDANKVSIFEAQARTYRTLQQVLIAQNKTDTALEIAERGRARAFV